MLEDPVVVKRRAVLGSNALGWLSFLIRLEFPNWVETRSPEQDLADLAAERRELHAELHGYSAGSDESDGCDA